MDCSSNCMSRRQLFESAEVHEEINRAGIVLESRSAQSAKLFRDYNHLRLDFLLLKACIEKVHELQVERERTTDRSNIPGGRDCVSLLAFWGSATERV